MTNPSNRSWMASQSRHVPLDVVEGRAASPHLTGKPVEGGDKAQQRILRGRLIQDGERTYHCYSADELIEIDSLAHHGRPGMPY